MNTYQTCRLIALILIAIMLLFCGLKAVGEPLPDKFVTAIHKVESGGRVGLILGDHGKALGPLQIHREYWADSGVKGSYSQCTNLVYARNVMTAYLNRYAKSAIVAGDYESLARIHNGGPLGYRRASTLAYWKKVKKALDK